MSVLVLPKALPRSGACRPDLARPPVTLPSSVALPFSVTAPAAPGSAGPLPDDLPGRSLALPRGIDGNRTGSAGPGPAASSAATFAKLLIVEDDWFIALEIEDVARSAGYEVVGLAATADEAVELALAQRPGLVLMDIRLAGPRDGIEAALELRERGDIPSLFVSAHEDPGVRAKAAPARPLGWLAKPFTEQQLTEAITQALNGSGSAPSSA